MEPLARFLQFFFPKSEYFAGICYSIVLEVCVGLFVGQSSLRTVAASFDINKEYISVDATISTPIETWIKMGRK